MYQLSRTSLLRCARQASQMKFHSSAMMASSQAPIGDGPAPGEIEIKIAPVPRLNEDTDTKRARLLYQSRKRGILESDLLLSKFAKLYLKDMTRPELDEYDELLDEQDWDIYYWASKATGAPPTPERWENSPIMAKLREIAANKEQEILRMPDLN